MRAKQTLDSMTASTKRGPAPEATGPDVDPVDDVASAQATYNTEANFAPDELSTAYLSVAQALHPEVRAGNAKEGQLLVTGLPPVDAVILVVAGHTDQRRYSPDPSAKAQCYSPNAAYGIGNPGNVGDKLAKGQDSEDYIKATDGMYHLKCDVCPLSKWSDSGRKDDNGRAINIPPPCAEVDSFLCYSVTHGMPVIFNLKGSAMQAGRFIKTLSNGLGFGAYAIEVTSETRTKGNNVWKVPKVTLANEGLDPAELQAFAAMARLTVKTAGAIPAATPV